MSHLISAKQFTHHSHLAKLFNDVNKTELMLKVNSPVCPKVMASLFYQPSTRTRMSFESAMLRMCGQVISSENAAQFSSAIKGESLEDTVRVVSEYADVIVLRHPERGAAERAARHCTSNLINAGDGDGEHPTQALLDIYTIYKELGSVDGLRIALVGDMLYGRTVHSLLHLLSLYQDVSLLLICPKELELSFEMNNWLGDHSWTDWRYGRAVRELADWKPDIVYMTRAQQDGYKYNESLIMTERLAPQMPAHCRILHPLPRQREVALGVDKDPRACYFKQVAYGLRVRQAILAEMFSNSPSWA